MHIKYRFAYFCPNYTWIVTNMLKREITCWLCKQKSIDGVRWCLQSTTYDVGRMLGVAIKLNAQCSGAPYLLLNYKLGFKKKKLLEVDINMYRKDISLFMTYF